MVMMNGSIGRCHVYKGLLHGSVLSTLLRFHQRPLLASFEFSGYADSLALVCGGHNEDEVGA